MSSTPPRTVTLTHSVALKPYGSVAGGAVQALDVQVEHPNAQSALRVRYTLRADLTRLRIPRLASPRRADELWKHTCFEAFLRARSGPSYYELNVSPSTEWALYAFDDYRAGMAPANVARPPAVRVERTEQGLTLEVQLDLGILPLSRALALAAVIEEDSGSLSYWALKHPAAKPDFHHPDGFVLEI